MEFVQAGHADLGRARAVLMAAFDRYVKALGRELNDNSFAGLEEAVTQGNVWLARTPKGIDGVAMLRVEATSWVIQELAVSPHSQGQGVGTFLLQSIELRARSLGVESLSLYTAKVMERLIAFYQSQGYIRFHEGLPDHGNDDYIRVSMRKALI